jgi:hypothetical protein
MAGCPTDVPKAGSSALRRRHRGAGHHLETEFKAGAIRRTRATSYWHVHWNTAAVPVIPAGHHPIVLQSHSGWAGGELQPMGNIQTKPVRQRGKPQPRQEFR